NFTETWNVVITDANNVSSNANVIVNFKVTTSGVAVVRYIHTDGLGSPVAKSDANGNLIANSRTRYEPYGMTVAGTSIPTIGFTGHVNDADTGLTYMQQRYYDPVAGRFLSEDPVLTDSNSGASFNRYVYANNNPYKYIDPDGRQSLGSNNAPVYSPMGELGKGVRVWLGQLIKQTTNVATLALTTAGGPEAAFAKKSIVVTEESIKAVLKGSEMKTLQESISLPMVKDYVAKIEAGSVAPPIKVDGKIIVDGNHTYVAGLLTGKPAATTEGTAAMSQVAKAKPIEELKISKTDFRDPPK
ncbi:RHS repeat-associated core domain-containing protein, partial [Undibacterium amnicola]